MARGTVQLLLGIRSPARSCIKLGLPRPALQPLQVGKPPSHQRKQLCRGGKEEVKPHSWWGTLSPANTAAAEDTEGREALGKGDDQECNEKQLRPGIMVLETEV